MSEDYFTIESALLVDGQQYTNDTISDNFIIDSSSLISNEFCGVVQEVIPDNVDGLDENHMMIYTIPDSEQLYGIQMARDTEGVLQKYRFKVKQTEDGQYEAIPETIRIVNECVQKPIQVQVQQEQCLNDMQMNGEETVEIIIKNPVMKKRKKSSKIVASITTPCKRQMSSKVLQSLVVQAPVRKGRIPRKQQIVPVQRIDEEIVVKEMLVADNNFYETDIQSDEQSNNTVGSYIDLTDDVEQDHQQEIIDINEEIEDYSKDEEFACNKCSRTFPSQNSLKTHKQFHHLQQKLSLRNHNNNNNINGMLKKSKKISRNCAFCLQTLETQSEFNMHTCKKIINRPRTRRRNR